MNRRLCACVRASVCVCIMCAWRELLCVCVCMCACAREHRTVYVNMFQCHDTTVSSIAVT